MIDNETTSSDMDSKEWLSHEANQQEAELSLSDNDKVQFAKAAYNIMQGNLYDEYGMPIEYDNDLSINGFTVQNQEELTVGYKDTGGIPNNSASNIAIANQAPPNFPTILYSGDPIQRLSGAVNFADVVPKNVDWLWKDFIPFGFLTIFAGEQGVGKSTVLAHIAALTTRLGYKVIYQNAEDDPERMTIGRFAKAQALVDRIMYIKEDIKTLRIDDPRFEEYIRDFNARLVIIDPMQSFLGSKVNINSANEIRDIIKPVTKLAMDYNCAVIIVCHLTKANYSKVLTRILGSTDITAAARHVCAIGQNPENAEDRAIVVVKSNVGQTGMSFGYNLTLPEFWTGPSTLTEDVMFSNNNYSNKPKASPQRDNAKSLILKCISQGITDGDAIRKEADSQNIAQSTLRLAREDLGIKPGSGNSKQAWVLPKNLINTNPIPESNNE